MKNLRSFFLVLVLILASTTAMAETGRIVAIGDLHGDLEATRQVFQLAGAIDENDSWIGGDLTIVQTGDQLDRGDGERAILHLLDRLQDEAAAAGGALHILNGNHELMNVRLDLRYVTEGGFADFADLATGAEQDSLFLAHPEEQRGRVAAFRPGAPYALMVADQPVILVLDETVFVHGGVLPMHLEYGIDRINQEVRQWILGHGQPPAFIHKGASPTWTRDYSDEVGADDCQQLSKVLEKLGAKRMVVGHTVQDDGVTSYCSDQLWCIDSGLSQYYGNRVQALEIVDGQMRILGQ